MVAGHAPRRLRPPRTLRARRRSSDRAGRPRSPVAPPPPLILRQFLRPCARLAIDAVSALDAAAFTARFDDVAEDSPWVAEVAYRIASQADEE